MSEINSTKEIEIEGGHKVDGPEDETEDGRTVASKEERERAIASSKIGELKSSDES